jgi:hypothetical protein
MGVPNLWPELKPRIEATPLGILREQKELLHRQTSGLLEAEIVTRADRDFFHHSFNVVAPALGDYRIPLLLISHPLALYPVNIETEGGNSVVVNTQDEFLSQLKLGLQRKQSVLEQLLGESLPASMRAELIG